MTICEIPGFDGDEILPLYAAVGWTNYTRRPEMLRAGFAASLLKLGAYEDGRLAGLLRAVGDGASVVFIQDLLVDPDYQHRGIGTALVKELLSRFPEVYQIELLSDDTEKTKAFYRSLGFTDAGDFGCRSFLRMRE